MISLFFKSLLWFSASFIILSVPISNKPLFDHLSVAFGDLTQEFISDFSKKAKKSLDVGKAGVQKMFETVPKTSADKVKVKQSSVNKVQEIENEQDEYTIEERQLLEQILKQ